MHQVGAVFWLLYFKLARVLPFLSQAGPQGCPQSRKFYVQDFVGGGCVCLDAIPIRSTVHATERGVYAHVLYALVTASENAQVLMFFE